MGKAYDMKHGIAYMIAKVEILKEENISNVKSAMKKLHELFLYA